MKRTLLFLTAFVLAGFALAQGNLPEWDWAMLTKLWENPVFMTVAIVGLVNAVRKSQAWLDGPVLVPVFAAGAGGILGAGGQFFDMLTVLPFTEWTFPIGGLAYGVSCALTGTLGLNVIEYVTALFNRNRTDTAALALVAAGHSPSAGAWIVEQARSLVPQNKVTPALEALAPLIASVANQLLTDELRADLQTKIHRTLKDAGLLRGRNFGDPA